MARYTRKNAEACAKRLARVLKKQYGNCWERKKGKLKAKIGCWRLDYNPIYGGAAIEEISNEYGGVTLIGGLGARLKPYEFCTATRIAEDAVKIAKKKRR